MINLITFREKESLNRNGNSKTVFQLRPDAFLLIEYWQMKIASSKEGYGELGCAGGNIKQDTEEMKKFTASGDTTLRYLMILSHIYKVIQKANLVKAWENIEQGYRNTFISRLYEEIYGKQEGLFNQITLENLIEVSKVTTIKSIESQTDIEKVLRVAHFDASCDKIVKLFGYLVIFSDRIELVYDNGNLQKASIKISDLTLPENSKIMGIFSSQLKIIEILSIVLLRYVGLECVDVFTSKFLNALEINIHHHNNTDTFNTGKQLEQSQVCGNLEDLKTELNSLIREQYGKTYHIRLSGGDTKFFD